MSAVHAAAENAGSPVPPVPETFCGKWSEGDRIAVRRREWTCCGCLQLLAEDYPAITRDVLSDCKPCGEEGSR